MKGHRIRGSAAGGSDLPWEDEDDLPFAEEHLPLEADGDGDLSEEQLSNANDDDVDVSTELAGFETGYLGRN